MRKLSTIAIAIAAVAALSLSPADAASPCPAAIGSGATEVINASLSAPAYVAPGDRLDPYAALDKINRFRAARGASPLAFDAALATAAHAHAADLAARDTISHYGADGSTPVDRVSAAGYDAIVTGENVATGQRRFEEVLDGWIESDGHRKTLLHPTAVHVGLALVYNPEASSRTFWTMVVAEPF